MSGNGDKRRGGLGLRAAEWVGVGGLPEGLNVVLRDGGVNSQDGQVLHLRLGDENAVERVTVMQGQAGDLQGVLYLDGQHFEVVGLNVGLDVYFRRQVENHFSGLRFDDDFPDAGNAEIDAIVRVLNGLPCYW